MTRAIDTRRLRTLNDSVALIASLAFVVAAQAGVYPDDAGRLWPNGVIPYAYTGDVNANQQCCVEAAMQAWEDVADVQFVPRNGEADYLRISNGTFGPAYPPPEGYRNGTGAHNLYLNGWASGGAGNCPTVDVTSAQAIFGLAHEVGHVLGLFHSHQRQDRNTYVDIDYGLIIDDFEGNYDVAFDSLAWPPNEMDVDSIMSYPLCVYSTCGGSCPNNLGTCAPITLLPPYDTIWAGLETCSGPQAPGDLCVGQRNHLSRYDKLLMSFLYPLSNWRFVDESYGGAETGTFH